MREVWEGRTVRKVWEGEHREGVQSGEYGRGKGGSGEGNLALEECVESMFREWSRDSILL